MKKLFFEIIIVLIISVFCFSEGYAQCSEDGIDCGVWGGTQVYTYTDPLNFPGCEIHIGYQVKVCLGITYFRLVYIGFDGEDPDCDLFLNFLLPTGIGNWADGTRLAIIWRSAFGQITQQWMNSADPTHKPCPGPPFYYCKTILPGGCAATQYAIRPYDATHPGQPTIHFKFSPCETEGCCITEIPFCWNNGWIAQGAATTQIIAGDCNNLQPIGNPFQNYGIEWTIYPASPCMKSCYIDN